MNKQAILRQYRDVASDDELEIIEFMLDNNIDYEDYASILIDEGYLELAEKIIQDIKKLKKEMYARLYIDNTEKQEKMALLYINLIRLLAELF